MSKFTVSNENIKIVSTSWMIQGTMCWAGIQENPQSEFNFLRAIILSLNGNRTQARVSYLEEKGPDEVPVKDIFECNPDYNNYPEGWNDMVTMNVLNEPEIVANVKLRYLKDFIFTFIGPTLIVMNPYKKIEALFNNTIFDSFISRFKAADDSSPKYPHIYQIASSCLQEFRNKKQNQAIVISGESGAGKTENAKYAMKFITGFNGSKGGIEDRILACNPILEAFGNAKTVRNDNSSRFGKYVKIHIEDNTIKGAEIRNYLLEKSRVTTIASGERNYHIFYHFLVGCSQAKLQELFITTQNFNYLQSSVKKVDTINDVELWHEVENSFKTMNFSTQEVDAILSVIATILHLGNVDFDDSTFTDNTPCSIKNTPSLDASAKVLSVNLDAYTKALLYKTREVAKQIIESPQNLNDCRSVQQSISRALYDKLFTWLVKKLNETIIESGGSKGVGLLDIFGFENFQLNSFEQLCINFTNEKLQQLYIAYVFKSEEDEFIKEGLGDYLKSIKYTDNQFILDLLDKHPQGIYDLVDESCQLGSGSDEQLIQKIAKTHAENAALKLPKMIQDKFSVCHTAKTVEYCITGFRVKNKDEISMDIEKLVMQSLNEQLKLIWEQSKPKEKESKFLGGKFRKQMKELMEELSSCKVHFVRCIKSNEEKRANYYLNPYVLQQIRYLGVLESIKVRKEGYPVRLDYSIFYSRYHELDQINRRFRLEKHEKMGTDMKGLVKEIIQRLFPQMDKKVLIFGHTKAYMKLELANDLDKLLADWMQYKISKAVQIQKAYKRYRSIKMVKETVKNVKKVSKSATKLKAYFKGKKQRKIYKIMRQKYRLEKGFNKFGRVFKRKAVNIWKKKQTNVQVDDYLLMQEDIYQGNEYDFDYNQLLQEQEEQQQAELLRQQQLKEEEEEVNRKLEAEAEEKKIQQQQDLERQQYYMVSNKASIRQFKDPFSTKGLTLWPQENGELLQEFLKSQNFNDSSHLKPIIIAIEEHPELLLRINNKKNILNSENFSKLIFVPANHNLPHYWNTDLNPASVAYNTININTHQVSPLPFSKHQRKYVYINLISYRFAKMSKQLEGFNEYTNEFLDTVRITTFIDYCDKYVHRGKNWLSRNMKMDDMMKFQSAPLREALTYSLQNAQAVLAYRCILKYSGIRRSRFPSEYHYQKLIRIMHGRDDFQVMLDGDSLKKNRNLFNQIIKKYLSNNPVQKDDQGQNEKKTVLDLILKKEADENEGEGDDLENMNNILEIKRMALLSTKQTRLREEIFLQMCKLINGAPDFALGKLFRLLKSQLMVPMLNFLKQFIECQPNQLIKVLARICFDLLAKQYQAVLVCQKAYEIQALQRDILPPSLEYFHIDQKCSERVSSLLEVLKIYKQDPIEERLWMLQQGMDTAVSFAQWIVPRLEARNIMPCLDEYPMPKQISNDDDVANSIQPLLKVYLHSDEIILVPIEAHYTIRLVIDQVCKILELEPIQQLFGLELVVIKDHEMIDDDLVDENEKILDLLRKIQNLENIFNISGAFVKLEYRFNLRMKVMYRLFKEDLVGLKLYASQALFQFRMNRFKLNLKEIIRISAINLHIIYGSLNEITPQITLQQLANNLKSFFPLRLVENEKDTTDFTQQDWAELIFKDYKTHQVTDYGIDIKHNPKMHLLNTLRPQIEFMAHQFTCSLTILKSSESGYKSYPSIQIILLIRPMQIALMDQKYRVLRVIEIVNLSQWGMGGNGIFLRCDGDELFFLFNFYKLKVVDNLLNSIINWNMKKPICYRYCPEYNDRIVWTTSAKDQQQGDYINGVDQKKYLKEKVVSGKGEQIYNSKEWANQKQDDKKDDDLAEQIRELQNELKKFDYNKIAVYDQFLQNDNPNHPTNPLTQHDPQKAVQVNDHQSISRMNDKKVEELQFQGDQLDPLAYNVYAYGNDFQNDAYEYGANYQIEEEKPFLVQK